MFLALIAGALDELTTQLRDTVSLIIETIEQHVHAFLMQALQLGTRTLRQEAKQFQALREVFQRK